MSTGARVIQIWGLIYSTGLGPWSVLPLERERKKGEPSSRRGLEGS